MPGNLSCRQCTCCRAYDTLHWRHWRLVLRSLESVKVFRELGLDAISVAVLGGFSHLQWDRSLPKSSVLWVKIYSSTWSYRAWRELWHLCFQRESRRSQATLNGNCLCYWLQKLGFYFCRMMFPGKYLCYSMYKYGDLLHIVNAGFLKN